MLSSRRSGELKNWPKKENNKGIETFLLYIYISVFRQIFNYDGKFDFLKNSLNTNLLYLFGKITIILIQTSFFWKFIRCNNAVTSKLFE